MFKFDYEYYFMYNTPLGKKLFDNVMSIGYNIMSAKAKMYRTDVAMIEDFIKRYDSNLYFKKSMNLNDLCSLVVYINDYTDYRIDLKTGDETLLETVKCHINDIGYDSFNSHAKQTDNIEIIKNTKNKIGLWHESHYEKNTIVINTGVVGDAVLNIDLDII